MKATTLTILIATAAACLLPGCMNSILPGLLQDERTIAKRIELQKAEIARAEKDLTELIAEAEADPTPENIAAVTAHQAKTNEANIKLVASELDLEEIKAEIAETRRLAKETGDAAAGTLTAYGGPWGPLLAGLVPFAGLIIRNVYTGKARREKEAKREAAMTNIVTTLDPHIKKIADTEVAEIRDDMTIPARNLVHELRDKAKT